MGKSKPKSEAASTGIKSKTDNRKTMALDIDHTLIYKIKNVKTKKLKDKYMIKLRSQLFHFLSNVNKNYKLVIWTGANKDYADYVINIIKKMDRCITKNKKKTKILNLIQFSNFHCMPCNQYVFGILFHKYRLH